jgi:hypothetical protein
MNPAVKWFGSIVAVPLIALVIYLAAVFQVYLIGWVVQLIGTIFD